MPSAIHSCCRGTVGNARCVSSCAGTQLAASSLGARVAADVEHERRAAAAERAAVQIVAARGHHEHEQPLDGKAMEVARDDLGGARQRLDARPRDRQRAARRGTNATRCVAPRDVQRLDGRAGRTPNRANRAAATRRRHTRRAPTRCTPVTKRMPARRRHREAIVATGRRVQRMQQPRRRRRLRSPRRARSPASDDKRVGRALELEAIAHAAAAHALGREPRVVLRRDRAPARCRRVGTATSRTNGSAPSSTENSCE